VILIDGSVVFKVATGNDLTSEMVEKFEKSRKFLNILNIFYNFFKMFLL